MRDFDGVNDNINYGSNAGIDAFTSKTYSFWLRWDGSDVIDLVAVKSSDTNGQGINTSTTLYGGPGSQLIYFHTWTTNDAVWKGTTQLNDAVWRHIAISRANGDTDVPSMYVNGVAETVTLVQAGTGTQNSDAANSLMNGESDVGTNDMDGAMGFFAYDDAIWTDAEVNRARWWGRPFGGIQVYHPLITDKLTNEGAATANGTATGTTNTNAAIPVVRPGTAMMGMGIGW